MPVLSDVVSIFLSSIVVVVTLKGNFCVVPLLHSANDITQKCHHNILIYRVSQNYVNTSGLFFSCAMGDRLTLEQKRMVASLMEVYGSPTVVGQKFAGRFAGRDPASRLTIYRVYAKFLSVNIISTNPVL